MRTVGVNAGLRGEYLFNDSFSLQAETSKA
jgi:hypothetical protein